MRIYISGCMTGYPGFNYPAFHEMADKLRKLGHTAINPAENFGGSTEHPEGRKAFMREDFKHVLNAEALVMLNGWQKSKGARIEREIAMELELPIMDENFQIIKKENILEEANRLVHGPRQASYGHPRSDFTRTGGIWGNIIPDHKAGQPIPPEIVGLCMLGVKISRECNAHKRDNTVDMAGYAATIEMLHG